MANGRCRLHGGRATSGPASATWKTGRYSRYAPQGILDRYEESRRDDDLLALREEIALIDGRLAQLLQTVGINAPGKLWADARDQFDRLRLALSRRDAGLANDATLKLGEALSTGGMEAANWEIIERLIELRRRLSESEQKRLVAMQQMITAEEAVIFLAQNSELLRRNLAGHPELLRSISDELRVVALKK